MNVLILTKISKFSVIGSSAAYLSFSSRNNPLLRQSLLYLLGGLITVSLIALLWEGRAAVTSESSGIEDSLSNLLSVNNSPKPKRQYLLTPQARLEIVIGLIVVFVCSLIGAL